MFISLRQNLFAKKKNPIKKNCAQKKKNAY